MARRRNKAEWISAIEQRGRRWRFKVGSGATATQTYSFESREEAEIEHQRVHKAQARLAKEQKVSTWATMIEKYIEHETERGRAKGRSLDTLEGRLRRFFESVLDDPLRLTPELGRKLYQKLRDRQTKDGKTISVQEQHHALSRAKAFVAWLVKEKFLYQDNLKDIEALGRPNRGKPQLTRDESVKLLKYCLKAKDQGAVATAVALLMGLRASEITERIVRDLDGKGTILHVTASKTEAGKRTLKVPKVLQPLLKKQTRDKLPTAKLIGHDRWWLRREVERLCQEANVPVVPPHGLRGTHASLARQAGAAPEVVAASLGHAGTAVQDRHYVKSDAASEGKQKQVEEALKVDSLPRNFPSTSQKKTVAQG